MPTVVGQVGPHQKVNAHLRAGRCLARHRGRAAVLRHAIGPTAQGALAIAAPAAVAADIKDRARSLMVAAPHLSQAGALRVLAAGAVGEAPLEKLVQAWAPDPGDCGPN